MHEQTHKSLAAYNMQKGSSAQACKDDVNEASVKLVLNPSSTCKAKCMDGYRHASGVGESDAFQCGTPSSASVYELTPQMTCTEAQCSA